MNHTTFDPIPALPPLLMPFEMAALPKIRFGIGLRDQLAARIGEISRKPLLILSRSVKNSAFGARLIDDLAKMGETPSVFTVSGEPSPETVDEIVQTAPTGIDRIIGIGGGSALDVAKAVAGLLPRRDSVMDYLEGVGAGKPYHGEALPWLAVPTTAGTGSETTKNAVLSRPGQFKKSFRHEALVAKEVWLDPRFLDTVPPETLHATALDALTQLLESYVTCKANPFTDALAWHGMQLWHGALDAFKQATDGKARMDAGGRLMLAATLSGITLANAGLGAVHGLAGPLGAFTHAPHGMACAALLAPITAANIHALERDTSPEAATALHKYAQVGRLLSGDARLPDDAAREALITALIRLNEAYGPGSLRRYGLDETAMERIIANCRAGSMLGNPLVLPDETLRAALEAAAGV